MPIQTICGSLRRPDLSGPLSIAKPDWETYCRKVADMIIAEQTPQRVMDVRAKMYELLSHCIPPTVIIKVCTLNPPRVIDTFAEPFLVDCCRRGCGTSGRELEGGHHALGSDLREGIFNLKWFASV